MKYIIPQQIFNSFLLAKKAFGGYKKQIIFLSILGFLSSFFEAIGINALIPLFSFFSEGGRVGDDIVSNSIRSLFSIIGVEFNLPMVLVLISTLFLLKAFALLGFNQIQEIIRANYMQKTMKGLFKGTLSAGWPYLLEQKLGYLETVLVIDIRKSAVLLQSIAKFISIATGLLVYLLIAINISQTVTLLAIAMGGVIFLVFKPFLYKTRELVRKTVLLNKKVAHHVNESISGMKTLKTMAVEEKIEETANIFFDQLKIQQIHTYLYKQIATIFVQPMSVIFISFIVAFSFYQTSYNLGALAAIIYLIQRVFTYIQDSQSVIHEINRGMPYLQNVLDYKDKIERAQENQVGSNVPELKNNLSFNDVCFDYNNGNEILKDICFTVCRGEMLGIVGASGSGKTTLFDLILRFFTPQKGEIIYDNRNIKEFNLKEWRDKIAYVSQDMFMVNDTIRHNIQFYNNSISEEDIKIAVKMAHADFIYDLPEGINTVVGERGSLLSAGQCQRIAFARAIARKPQILLLDEATSALDPESESHIQETIKGLKGKMTIFVVAHRLSTVMDSDNLIVLEKGKIIERGKPNDLLKNKNTHFYKIFQIR